MKVSKSVGRLNYKVAILVKVTMSLTLTPFGFLGAKDSPNWRRLSLFQYRIRANSSVPISNAIKVVLGNSTSWEVCFVPIFLVFPFNV